MGVGYGLNLAMCSLIIMIVHVGGGRCVCCHIGLGAVDPDHDLKVLPWLLSTVCGMPGNVWMYRLSAA